MPAHKGRGGSSRGGDGNEGGGNTTGSKDTNTCRISISKQAPGGATSQQQHRRLPSLISCWLWHVHQRHHGKGLNPLALASPATVAQSGRCLSDACNDNPENCTSIECSPIFFFSFPCANVEEFTKQMSLGHQDVVFTNESE